MRLSLGSVPYEIGHEVDGFDHLLARHNALLDENVQQAFAEHQRDLPVRIGCYHDVLSVWKGRSLAAVERQANSERHDFIQMDDRSITTPSDESGR